MSGSDHTDRAMLRAPEAAAFLGVAIKTLANWRSMGAGPRFCRLGRVIAYRPEDLRAFVDAQLQTTAGPAKPQG